jgi:hypothetical protein
MKLTFAKSAIIICALLSSAEGFAASSNHWIDPVKLCKANPNCKHELPGSAAAGSGASHFIIRKFNSEIYVRCEDNGNCRRMFPRGSSEPIDNLTALFAAE